MKEEALKLADELIKGELIDIYEKYTQQWKKGKVTEASAMIRRLVAENDRLTRDLIGASLYEHDYKTLIEKLKPLSDEEINLYKNLRLATQHYREAVGFYESNNRWQSVYEALDAIDDYEERHGIL